MLTVTPLDVGKAPFRELRQAIPIRLTTDAWTPEVVEHGYMPTEYSDHQEDYRDTQDDTATEAGAEPLPQPGYV